MTHNTPIPETQNEIRGIKIGNPLIEKGLCHYCGKEKIIYNVDPLIIAIDNCKGLYICEECNKKASKINDKVDNIINNVIGITPYTKKEMKELRNNLEILKVKRLNKDKSIAHLSFFKWIKTEGYKEQFKNLVKYSDNYKEWCKKQYPNNCIV